eukprot:8526652-Pyramimonas_sp.AAC.2
MSGRAVSSTIWRPKGCSWKVKASRTGASPRRRRRRRPSVPCSHHCTDGVRTAAALTRMPPCAMHPTAQT